MDFRRIPFQFSTTDPLKRQEELRKRFGLPAEKDKMHIDFSNPGSMGAKAEETNSSTNSPRLQHRVPIFVEGSSEPVKSSVDNSQNIDAGRKPHIRVIPIEIENTDSTSKRHRSLSGSYGCQNEPLSKNIFTPEETVKHPVAKSSKAPKVCNIPIKIEGSNIKPKSSSPVKSPKAKTPEVPKNINVKLNGCSASKVAKVAEQNELPEQVTLKKIEKIIEKLEGYHADVENFSGTDKDKQYRYLDEMLTRCMLELDEIDTMGLDSIRLSRKGAVKKVQSSIDLLESKVVRETEAKSFKESMEIEPENVATTMILNEGTPKEAETTSNGQEQASQMDLGVENISITETEDVDMKPENCKVIQNDKQEVSENDKNVAMADSETDVSNAETADLTVQITEMDADTESTSVMETEPVIEEPLLESKEGKVVEADCDSCKDLNSENTSVVIKEMNEEEESRVDSRERVEANQSSKSDVEMKDTETSHISIISTSNDQGGVNSSEVTSITVPDVVTELNSTELQPDHLVNGIRNTNVSVTSSL
ncbi:hypothetical protein NPIL_617391 [Nephila pilipes]|uniref:BAG domain-containing protein n=1 Tax=Nephila pilipes TaxID=299642 RepID=A0A8X6JF93_NEPPI|nr:hypothetical protein NPIL_617391 [Nephila pilipes]